LISVHGRSDNKANRAGNGHMAVMLLLVS